MILPPEYNRYSVPPASPPSTNKIDNASENSFLLSELPFHSLSTEDIQFAVKIAKLDDIMTLEIESILAQKEAEIESHLKRLETKKDEQHVVKKIIDVQEWVSDYAVGINEAIDAGKIFLENCIIPGKVLAVGSALKGVVDYSDNMLKLGRNYLEALQKGSLGHALTAKGEILKETKRALSLLTVEYNNKLKSMKEYLRTLGAEERKVFKITKLAELKEIKKTISNLTLQIKKETKQCQKDQKRFSEKVVNTSLLLITHAASWIENAFIYSKYLSQTFSLASGTLGFVSAFAALRSESKNYTRFREWINRYQKWEGRSSSSGTIEERLDAIARCYEADWEYTDEKGVKSSVSYEDVQRLYREGIPLNQFKALPSQEPKKSFGTVKLEVPTSEQIKLALEKKKVPVEYEKDFLKQIIQLHDHAEGKKSLANCGYNLDDKTTVRDFKQQIANSDELYYNLLKGYTVYIDKQPAKLENAPSSPQTEKFSRDEEDFLMEIILLKSHTELKKILNKEDFDLYNEMPIGEFKELLARDPALYNSLLQKYSEAKNNQSADSYEEEFISEISQLKSIEEAKKTLKEYGYTLAEELTITQFHNKLKIDPAFKEEIFSSYTNYRETLKAFDSAINDARNLVEKRRAVVEKKAFLLAPQIHSLLPKIKELKKTQFIYQIRSTIKANINASVDEIKKELKTHSIDLGKDLGMIEKIRSTGDIDLGKKLEGGVVDKDKLIRGLCEIVDRGLKKGSGKEDFQEALKLVQNELLSLKPPITLPVQIPEGMTKEAFQSQMNQLIRVSIKGEHAPPILESQEIVSKTVLNKKFEKWFDSQNPLTETDPSAQQAKIKSLLTSYIDHQEIIEQTTKTALAEMVKKKQQVDSSLVKMKLLQATTFFTLSGIMLAITTAIWFLGITTLPFGGIGALVLVLSLPSIIATAGFFLTAVYLHNKRNPEVSKEHLKGTSIKLLFSSIWTALNEYWYASNQKKLLTTAAIVKAIRSKASLTRNDPDYEKAYKNYLEAKKAFEKGQEKIKRWTEKTEHLKEKIENAAWRDYASHAKLKVGESQGDFDALTALNHALKEADLNLMNAETKELLETHLGIDIERLQEKFAVDSAEIKKALQKFFIMSDAEYIKFMKQQEMRLDVKLIKIS